MNMMVSFWPVFPIMHKQQIGQKNKTKTKTAVHLMLLVPDFLKTSILISIIKQKIRQAA